MLNLSIAKENMQIPEQHIFLKSCKMSSSECILYQRRLRYFWCAVWYYK